MSTRFRVKRQVYKTGLHAFLQAGSVLDIVVSLTCQVRWVGRSGGCNIAQEITSQACWRAHNKNWYSNYFLYLQVGSRKHQCFVPIFYVVL